MKLIPHPSPNSGPRRDQAIPSLVVLHYTAMATTELALERLCTPEFEVSSHYLIAEDGRIFALVDEADRAWHAGAGCWGGITDINSASIGIELANPGNVPFAAPLMSALEVLLADILRRHALPPKRVIAHSDCAPGRKSDPGPRFDWLRLARQGLSVWPKHAATSPGDLTADLAAFGYAKGATPEATLAAFRLRFRPGAEGPPDATDAALAADLARRYPVNSPPAA